MKAARGERVGTVPFGFRLDADGVHLVADETEQEAIVYIRALRTEGLSLRAIVARLRAEGRTARHGSWHLRSVQNVLAA